MWAVSDRFLATARTAHVRYSEASHLDPFTGTVTEPLPIEGGSITDDANAVIRRTLSLTLPSVQNLYDALAAPGGEITVSTTYRYVDGATETLPAGVFVVDADSIKYSPSGTIVLTCPDRWLRVQRNRFGITGRTSVASNTVHAEIQRLVEGAWASGFPGWAQLDTSATAKVGHLVWDDGDREAAILNLAKAHSLEVFFDRQGLAVLRPIPLLSTTSPFVWSVNAGDDGVLIDADRVRDRSRTRNAVIASTSAVGKVVAPQEKKNTTAGDPLRTAGPLGYVPYYFTSPVLKTTGALQAAALTQLKKQLGVASWMSLEASPNPALDSEDVIQVVLPNIDRFTPRPTELHILDTVVTPLMSADTQTMQTRSTRPDTDGS